MLTTLLKPTSGKVELDRLNPSVEHNEARKRRNQFPRAAGSNSGDAVGLHHVYRAGDRDRFGFVGFSGLPVDHELLGHACRLTSRSYR
jgi:hypothetical protein